MIEEAEIEALIRAAFPDAQIKVTDTTGGKDHFQVAVASDQFKGKSLIDQHRMVQDALKDALEDNRIHALQIKTKTREAITKGNDFQILD